MDSEEPGKFPEKTIICCSNIKCGYTWKTINKKRTQKCFKCTSKGIIPSKDDMTKNKAKSSGRSSAQLPQQDSRQQKLVELKQKIEADNNDPDDFRLSTFERKAINKKIRYLESSKIYAEYWCGCRNITWTSVHGWTYFTQHCIYCRQLAECLGPISLTNDEIQAKMHRSVRRMINGVSNHAVVFGHDPRRCQMCGIFVANGLDINCMKKKWTRLEERGSTYIVVQSY